MKEPTKVASSRKSPDQARSHIVPWVVRPAPERFPFPMDSASCQPIGQPARSIFQPSTRLPTLREKEGWSPVARGMTTETPKESGITRVCSPNQRILWFDQGHVSLSMVASVHYLGSSAPWPRARAAPNTAQLGPISEPPNPRSVTSGC